MTLSHTFPRALTGVLATAAMLCAAAPATAVPANPWQPSRVLSDEGQSTLSPTLAVAPDGSVTAAWQASGQVYTRTLWAGDANWSDAGPMPDGATANGITLVADRDSNFTASWTNQGGSPFFKVATLLNRQSTWSAPLDLTDGQGASGGTIARGPDGTVVAAYGIWDGAQSLQTLRVHTRLANSTDWDETFKEVDKGDTPLGNPDLAFTDAGDGEIVWIATPSSGPRELRAAHFSQTTHGWSGVDDGIQSDGLQIGRVSVAIDNDDNVAVVWAPENGSGMYGTGKAAGSPGWSDRAPLSDSGDGALMPDVAARQNGTFVATWQAYNFPDPSDNAHPQYSVFNPGTGTWTTAAAVAGETHGGAPVLGANSDGDIAVSMVGTTSFPEIQQVVSRFPADGDRFLPIFKAGDRSRPWMGPGSAALDPEGNMYLVFSQAPTDDDFENASVAYSYADGAGPGLNGLSIPNAGLTGQRLSFAVNPLDAWSSLGSTTWDFGDAFTYSDGTDAQSLAPSGSFASAGDRTVTVTSTDIFGNATSATGTVTVTDPPPPPPAVKEKTKLPPVIPARLAGKKITITTTVPNCSSKFVATTKFGTTKYQTKLKLTKNGKLCTATGTIVLKKAPGTRTKLRVAIGRVTKTGTKTIATLTTKRS